MAAHNEARFLAPAIQSIRDQDFDDFEFIIIDDGSTDATLEIIEHHAGLDARIRFRTQPNSGLSQALNLALSLSTGEYVARMDADDCCLAGRFSAQVAYLDQHADVGVVGTWSYLADETYEYGDSLDNAAIMVLPLEPEASIERVECGLWHPTVMVRRPMFEKIGGYRPFYIYAEDLDLWYRMGGHTLFRNLPEPLFVKRRHKARAGYKHFFLQTESAVIAAEMAERRQLGESDPTDHIAPTRFRLWKTGLPILHMIEMQWLVIAECWERW